MKKTKTVKHNIPIKGEPPFLEQNDFIAPEDANHIAKLAFQKRGKELLKAARKEIRASASNGEYHTEMIIPGYDLAQYVFNILLSDGYELKIQSLSDRIGDERIGLSIDWSGPDSDTGKKYVLPMEDTETRMGNKLYAFKVGNQWCAGFALNDDAAIDYENIVTAKDLRDAPDWVKVIEPVEVN